MTPQEALERAIEYFGQRNHTATAWDYTDENEGGNLDWPSETRPAGRGSNLTRASALPAWGRAYGWGVVWRQASELPRHILVAGVFARLTGTSAGGRVTYEEAKALKSFKHYCMCGGYAWQMNGRPESQPHTDWCRQHDEYGEWWTALHSRDGDKSE